MLPPQLLGLNLDPGILRCEHSQLVELGGGGREGCGLEWEGPSSGTLSLSLSDPWNLLPGTLATFPEGARGQTWLGLFTLYLDHAASGHPALSQSFYSPFVLTDGGGGRWSGGLCLWRGCRFLL